MKDYLLIFIFLFSSFYSYSDEGKSISVAYQYIKNELPEMEACVSYQMYQEDDDFYYIKVRAENRNKECEGDPNISVTLFNFKVSKSSNQLYKEIELGLNNYQPIKINTQSIQGEYSHEYK